MPVYRSGVGTAFCILLSCATAAHAEIISLSCAYKDTLVGLLIDTDRNTVNRTVVSLTVTADMISWEPPTSYSDRGGGPRGLIDRRTGLLSDYWYSQNHGYGGTFQCERAKNDQKKF